MTVKDAKNVITNSISSYFSKFRRIGRCPQIVILHSSDIRRIETPNPSTRRIGTCTAPASRHYRHNIP